MPFDRYEYYLFQKEDPVMKYGRFLYNGEIKHGMVDGDRVIELLGTYLDEPAVPTDRVYRLEDVKWLAPVEPKQVIAIGLNYVDHAKEQNKPLPKEPMMFMVSPSAIIGPGESIRLAKPTHRIDYEAELAVVIGKKAHRVTEAEALDVVFGYTVAIDVSDRDLQARDGQYTRAKSYPTYKPIGPFVATDVNPSNLSIKLTQNGVTKQDGHTSDMVHSVEKIIAAVTEVMTLEPGDVILTGTPAGVGPLHPGDDVAATIEGIGTLQVTVL